MPSPKSFAKPTMVCFTVPMRFVTSARSSINWRNSRSACCITSTTWRFSPPGASAAAWSAVCPLSIGDLFFVEGDHFLDRAHALLEVFAHPQQPANHNGRARQGLEHAQLAALN